MSSNPYSLYEFSHIASMLWPWSIDNVILFGPYFDDGACLLDIEVRYPHDGHFSEQIGHVIALPNATRVVGPK